MHRRDVLRILATGTALQLAPNRLITVLREARSLLAEQVPLRTLNAHQEATVRTMAELILPRTDTPGATDVGTSAFIDLILTEWSDDTNFLNGLADVDARTQKMFEKDFVDCSAEQQSEILIVLGDEMVREIEISPRRRRRLNGAGNSNFYAMFRRLTLTAYYTSEAGATQELHFEIIPNRFEPCAKTSPEKDEQS
jgi:Gluconate 2-dehydrogenase subunit 3